MFRLNLYFSQSVKLILKEKSTMLIMQG